MTLEFDTFKLLDHPPSTYPKGNLFSYVLETAWYNLKQNKLSDAELLEHKKSILERMKNDGHSSAEIYSFLKFIVYYTRFEKKEYFYKFEEHVNSIIKNDKHMSIIEMDKIKFAEQKKIEGKVEGVDLSVEIIKLLKAGLSVEVIAAKLKTDTNTVEKIKKTFS